MAFARVWPFPTLSRSPIEEQNDTTHDRAKIIGTEPGAGWMRKTVQAVEQYRLALQLAEGSTAGIPATAHRRDAVDPDLDGCAICHETPARPQRRVFRLGPTT
ncbi:hypothetical protein [Paracoccus versutus]